MTLIKMKVNASALVQTMRDAFTSESAVITELAQNSRRAKASCITFAVGNFRRVPIPPEEKQANHYNCSEKKTIFDMDVIDDGTGIPNMQKLLSIAESGWDKDTIAQENPFGVGLLVAIYQSEEITVTSLGRTFTTTQKELLAFEPIEVIPATESSEYTTISLKNVSIYDVNSFDDFKKQVQNKLKGFEVPIAVMNNETNTTGLICRDHSFEHLKSQTDKYVWYTYPEGTLFLNRSSITQTHWGNFDPSTAVFFQGLRVSQMSLALPSFTKGFFHATKALGRVQLPDRSNFVNSHQVCTKLRKIVKKSVQSYALSIKHDHELLKKSYKLLSYLDLLNWYNDLDDLPDIELEGFNSTHVSVVDNMLKGDIFQAVIFCSNNITITRETAKDFIVFTYNDSITDYFSGVACKYGHTGKGFALAYLFELTPQLDYVVVSCDLLDKDHWLFKNAVDLSEAIEATSIHVGKEIPQILEKKNPLQQASVILCDHFEIKTKINNVEYTSGKIDDDYCLGNTPDGTLGVYIPNNFTGIYYVEDSECFFDEYECYNETLACTAQEEFDTWLRLERNVNDPAGIIKSLLDFAILKQFKGQKFEVEIAEDTIFVTKNQGVHHEH